MSALLAVPPALAASPRCSTGPHRLFSSLFCNLPRAAHGRPLSAGFPEDFKLPANGAADGPSSALFGNAVSPPVVAAIVESMLAHAGIGAARAAVARRGWGGKGALECYDCRLLGVALALCEDAAPAERRPELRKVVEAALQRPPNPPGAAGFAAAIVHGGGDGDGGGGRGGGGGGLDSSIVGTVEPEAEGSAVELR